MARQPPAHLEAPRLAVRDAIGKIVEDHKEERARNPKQFRDEMLREARAALPPAPPGRHGCPLAKAAARYREQGKSWAWIYKTVIPGFAGLSEVPREKRSKTLRGRVRALNSAKRTKQGKKSRPG